MIYSIIVGLIAGWLAGQVMKGGGYGLLMDIVLGLLGGILGGWLFGSLGIWPAGGVIGSILVSFVGAVILVALTENAEARLSRTITARLDRSSARVDEGVVRTRPSHPRLTNNSLIIGGHRSSGSLLGERLDQAVLKLQPLEILLHTDPLVPSVGTHVVHVAERAVDTEGRDPGVAEVQAVGRAGAHHRHDDDAGEHVLGERLDRLHHVGP